MHIALLVLLTSIVYANSVFVDFIGDDFCQVVVSRDCNVLCSVTTVFRAFGKFYRPMHLLFYRFGYLLAGYEPMFYHVVSVGLHTGVVLLLYGLIVLLGQGYLDAVLAAALFAVSPIHTNAVSWLAGVEDPMMTLWLLLTVICYVWSTRTPVHTRLLLMLSALCFCLALLSQESAVVVPVILAAYEVLGRRRALSSWRMWGGRLVPYAFLDILYYGYSRGIVGARGASLGESSYTYALGLGVIQNVVYFGLALFSPVDLYPLIGLLEELSGAVVRIVRTPAGMVAFGVLAIIFLIGLLWLWRRMSGIARFWLVWIPLSLLPVLTLGHASELYLYLPSIGSCVLMATLAGHLYRGATRGSVRWIRVVPVGLIVAVVVLYGLSTIRRNQVYLQVGNTGKDILAQVRRMRPSVPEGSHLYFANAAHVEQGLSVMGLKGVDVLSPWGLPCAIKIVYQNDSIDASLLESDDMAAKLRQADCVRADSYYFVWEEAGLEERFCER